MKLRMNLSNNLGRNRCCINNLNADQGLTGNKGPQGAYGPIGEIGITGGTGVTGPQGATGLCYRGYKGPQGAVGPQGVALGNKGPSGIVGDPGPKGASKNLLFSFNTRHLNASYSSSSDFINLNSLADNTVLLETQNTIALENGTYAIQFEINETWRDPLNKCYIRFYNVINNVINGYTYSSVFNETNHLVLNTSESNTIISNTNKTYGSGNDVVTLSGGIYGIELFQATNSQSIINISDKTITFSITFIKLS